MGLKSKVIGWLDNYWRHVPRLTRHDPQQWTTATIIEFMATRAVVSAGSIAPQAYAHDDGNEAPEDVQYDLYNLLLVDHHAVSSVWPFLFTDSSVTMCTGEPG